MADGKRLLQIVIAGDPKGALKAFGDVEAGADGLGSKLKSFGSAFGKAGEVAAVVGIAAGAALFKLGSDFDEAYDKIRVATGATGAELDALKTDFKTVFTSVPTDMESASTAVSKFASALGDSGPHVDGLSEQMLELSRMTKTDLSGNLDASIGVIKNWGLEGDDMTSKMDEIFRASQATGVSFTDLSTQMQDAGVTLRASGMDFDSALGLISELGQAGVDTSDVMPALSKSLATAAKDGKDASALFKDTVDAIKKAPDATSAAGTAMEVFGAKAGPKFAELIREGKLDYQDLMQSIAGGTETIMGAGKDTQDFGEKWEVIKNKVLVALEPIAMKVFDGVGKAMDKLGPVVDRLSAAFSKDGLGGVFSELGDMISTAWPGVQSALSDMGQHVLSWVGAEIPVLLRKLGEWGQAFIDWIGPRIGPMLEELGKLLGKLSEWFLDTGMPLLLEKLRDFGQAFIAWIGPAIPPMLEELGKLIAEVGRWIVTDAIPKLVSKNLEWAKGLFGWIGSEGLQVLGAGLGFVADHIVEWGASLYNLLTAPFRAAFNFVSDLWNNTVGRLHFSIPDWVPFGLGGKEFNMPNMPHWGAIDTGGGGSGGGGAAVTRLARGGIVTSPTLFGDRLVGDNRSGVEAIVPLERAAEMGFGGGTTVHIGQIVASGYEQGRQAAQGILDALEEATRNGGRFGPTTRRELLAVSR